MLLSHQLRGTNQRLSLLLASLRSEAGDPVLATPEQMAALLSELLPTAGDVLGECRLRDQIHLAQTENSGVNLQLEDYRRHLEQLHDLLPALHRRLLEERAQLEEQRSQTRSASEWASAWRQAF